MIPKKNKNWEVFRLVLENGGVILSGPVLRAYPGVLLGVFRSGLPSFISVFSRLSHREVRNRFPGIFPQTEGTFDRVSFRSDTGTFQVQLPGPLCVEHSWLQESG